jgi:hypothetical protein
MDSVTVDEFLSAIFKYQQPQAFTCDHRFRAIPPSKLNKNHSLYYAICAVTNQTRKNDNFISLNVLVCDDVGTKAETPSLPPSYIIESSPNNFQYGYILTTPEPDAQKAKALIDALIKSGYTDAGAHGIVRLVRLPTGTNTKPGNNDFQVHLTHWDPTTTYTYNELSEFFGVKSKDKKEYSGYEIPTHILNGQRNTELTKLCGYLFSANATLAEVTTKMALYNVTLCETPLPSEELQTIINSIYNRHTERYSEIIDNVYHVQSTATWFDFRIMADIPTPSLNTSHLKEFSGKKDQKPKLSEWLPKQEGFNEAVGLSWSPVPHGQQKRIITIDGNKHINTWRGFAIEPQTGDVEPWLTHLAHVVPEPNYRRALLWWLAFTIQCPDKRTSWQPIILGVSGAGKDALFRPVATILGSAFKTIGNKDIQGDFDDGLLGTKLLHISEASGLRGASIDFYKRITAAESSDMQMLNIKCKGKVMQHNLCNVLVITNNIDAMRFTKDERRAFVLRSPNVMTEDQQTAYFDNWLDNDGASYLFNYLLRYDLSEYKPGVRPYRTKHFEELLTVTQSDNEIRIENLLEEYEIALPDLIRQTLGADGDKYGTTKIIVWLQENGWIRWDQNQESKRIKRSINGVQCPPKSRHWYVKKGSKYVGSTPSDMCKEVERVEELFMKKHKF